MLSSSMTIFSFFGAFAAWLGADVVGPGVQTVRRLVVQDTVIFRIPVRPSAPGPHIEWIEHKGPKCLPADAIAGALLAGPDTIDFLMRDRRRVRAVLDSDCPGIDFYGGFYVQPSDDRLCAKRDEIRSRVGGSCRIGRFRTLVPHVKD